MLSDFGLFRARKGAIGFDRDQVISLEDLDLRRRAYWSRGGKGGIEELLYSKFPHFRLVMSPEIGDFLLKSGNFVLIVFPLLDHTIHLGVEGSHLCLKRFELLNARLEVLGLFGVFVSP
jgi:hypothetical protein